jgi:hypothetical protein
MSINDATPSDWDRLRKQHPALDESLMKVYVGMTEEELDSYILSEEEDDEVVFTGYPEEEDEEDAVNNPSHYNTGSIECIEAIEESMTPEAYKGYLKGNCMKYLWRYDYKGKQVEDLEKAQWYLAKLLKEVVFDNEEDD